MPFFLGWSELLAKGALFISVDYSGELGDSLDLSCLQIASPPEGRSASVVRSTVPLLERWPAEALMLGRPRPTKTADSFLSLTENLTNCVHGASMFWTLKSKC